MIAEFARHGIRFKFPTNWRLEREDNESGWTASLQSPGTAFFLVSLRTDLPTVDELADSVLEAMREEYPELEAGDCVATLAGQPAVGHEIRFFSLDLTNTCQTRCLLTPQGTVLVLWQLTDLEEEASEPVLRAICASLEVEDE